jgi:phasin protein
MADTSRNDQSDTRDRNRVQTAVDQGADTARQIGAKSADAARNMTETAADATRRTAEVAADTTRHTADQAREATVAGFRALSGAQGPLTDAGFEQSQRALEVTSRVTGVYRQAAERAVEDVRALFDSSMSLGGGLQQWQQAYYDAVRQSVESIARKRPDFAQINSPVQFAEVQRDLYIELVNNSLKASTTLLQLAGQIAQNAVRPLQERAHARG